MKVYRIGEHRVAISEAWELVEKNYKSGKINLRKGRWIGGKPVQKSNKKMKLITAPYSMSKLLKLLEMDEYHFGCVDAIAKNVIMKVECSNSKVTNWFKEAQFPKRTNALKLLRQAVKYYTACGNGLLLKARNTKDEWVGLERFLPNEASIAEVFSSETGYLEPDYIQSRNNTKKYHLNKDVIHFLEETHKSEAWGLNSLPVAINIEILQEIKKFDYNNFKNGLLIDYIIIVEGGSIKDQEVLDEDGNPVVVDGKKLTAYDIIDQTFSSAKGNANSHGSVILESEEQGVKIRLERLRQDIPDGGFLKLKKDLREGIFAYHRTPPRVVSQLVAGQLGGDNNSDLTLFYENKIKPIQWDMATILASEFNSEFNWGISPEDFDFGDLTEGFLTADELIFKENKNS